MKKTIAIILSTLIIFWACGGGENNPKWAKVNTHVHTTNSDGDSDPGYVVQWYADHGYDAVAITDHDSTTEINSSDIITIPGMEESRPLHYTVLNGGDIEILNHPALVYQVDAEVSFFEVYNGYPSSTNDRTEFLWDEMLKRDQIAFGVASDDTHIFQTENPEAGEGWIMVKVDEISEENIIESIIAGDFYATTGVYLSVYSPEIMVVDYIKTGADICGHEIIKAGNFQRLKVACLVNGKEVFAWGQPVITNHP